MSCKNHAAGCNFSGSLEDVIVQEEDCPYRSVKCVVLSCYRDISFNGLEDHMAREHPNMSNGDWEIVRPVTLFFRTLNHISFFMIYIALRLVQMPLVVLASSLWLLTTPADAAITSRPLQITADIVAIIVAIMVSIMPTP